MPARHRRSLRLSAVATTAACALGLALTTSPVAGDAVTVRGHSFMLPGTQFNCSAMLGPALHAGLPCPCTLLSSSLALVRLPPNIIVAPSFLQLHFEPGNVTTTAATRLCPCVRARGGTVCGCAADTCAVRL